MFADIVGIAPAPPTLSLGEVVDRSEVVHGEGVCSPGFVFFFFPSSLRDIW